MGASQTIELSRHAIERFRERVCDGVDIEIAASRLEALVVGGALTIEAPHWLLRSAPEHTDAYLSVGDITLPLRADMADAGVLVATTALVRGGISARERRARNQRRRRRRVRRRAGVAA